MYTFRGDPSDYDGHLLLDRGYCSSYSSQELSKNAYLGHRFWAPIPELENGNPQGCCPGICILARDLDDSSIY